MNEPCYFPVIDSGSSLLYFLQRKHDLKGKAELLSLIRKFPDGIAVVDVKDAYPTIMEDLKAPSFNSIYII